MNHSRHNMSSDTQKYTCSMHPEVIQDKPGKCAKCGMSLIPTANLGKHDMKPVSEMSFWQKFKMSMTMAMGMEHTGLAGREMAKIMEEDIRNKFFISLFLTIPIVLLTYTPLSFPKNWLLLVLTTPVYFYSGWIFLYSRYISIF